MKIAYLMNGVIGGLVGKNGDNENTDARSDIIKYTSHTHQYLQNNHIDYFVFSWEPDLESTYIDQYRPKKIKCVPQIKFAMPLHYKEWESNVRLQSHYSRWYGAQQVMNLMMEYKKETGIEYDLVINARLDLCFQRSIDFTNFDKTKFHVAKPINISNYNWPRNNEMIDHIFASSEDNMALFLNLFDYLNEYTKPDECPRWKLISNHFLTVWHLNKLNLLKEDIIKESLSVMDGGFDSNVDYYIFRYKNLNYNQLKEYTNELY